MRWESIDCLSNLHISWAAERVWKWGKNPKGATSRGLQPRGAEVLISEVLGRGIPQHGEANNVKCPNANFTKFTALHNRDSYNHAFKLVVLLRHLGALPPDLTGVPPFDPLRTSIV